MTTTGDLDQPIVVEEPIPTEGEHGHEGNTWRPLPQLEFPVWAEVNELTAAEVDALDSIEGRVTHRLRVQHVRGVTQDHRAVFDDRDGVPRILAIRSVRRYDDTFDDWICDEVRGHGAPH